MLFLDEMLEFSRDVLEVLRQPLEEGSVALARAADGVSRRVHLVGAMNPCPCGFAGDRRALPVHAAGSWRVTASGCRDRSATDWI